MRKTKLIILVLAILVLAGMTAAAESLSGRIEGSTLIVTWNVDEIGECVLTVYQNDWPICVRNVSCAEGSASVPLGSVSGRYTLRLKTASGCLTAGVAGGKAEATSKPTPVETQKTTEVPTAEPVQTAAPTAVPTAAPTTIPAEPATESPTAIPEEPATEAPTSAPTQEPTATPSAAPTVVPTPVPSEAPTEEPTEVATPKPALTAPPKPTVRPAATPRPTTAVTAENRADLASQVVALTNEERAKQGLGALRTDGELTRAACVRAAEIVKSFSHTRPDGTSWSTVSGSAYAENIAKGQRTAERVIASWMTSEGHRANILRASYGSIGVCAYVSGGVTYWVQLFGR